MRNNFGHTDGLILPDAAFLRQSTGVMYQMEI
jgi:hypothetical protein